ncbi:MAG: hypothetical protein VKN33_04585 [Candidatus Sericytochromatia bacterium]|nr:hypothetical protein [Candidatus Sericytochromatia bacterium]
MKKVLALGMAIMTLSACGVQPLRNTSYVRRMSPVRTLNTDAIVDAPGVPVGVQQNCVGKYQKYKIKGVATIKTLDASLLDVVARLGAKVGPITVKKDVTFTLTRRDDTEWPYQFTVKNLTDKETIENKARKVSSEDGTTIFLLDDDTNSTFAADGEGTVRIASGDFDITFGKEAGLRALIGPIIQNPVRTRNWFSR